MTQREELIDALGFEDTRHMKEVLRLSEETATEIEELLARIVNDGDGSISPEVWAALYRLGRGFRLVSAASDDLVKHLFEGQQSCEP